MEHGDEKHDRKTRIWTIVGSFSLAVTILAGTVLLGFTAFPFDASMESLSGASDR